MDIGIIADTHGLVRTSALEALGGVALLLHAGDVGKSQVLEQLASIASVRAVRGNVDRGEWASELPLRLMVQVGGIRILLTHCLADVARPYAALGCQVIVTGHSHRPEIRWEDEVMLINPGSAGPRRFKLPVSVARLTITGSALSAQLLELGP